MIYPVVTNSPASTLREGHPQFRAFPVKQAPNRDYARFGNGGAMGVLQKTMSAIEANKLLELTISDVGAMVLPRTAIEAVKRGPVPAQETLFREISGTVTNTYLAGWLGALAAVCFGIKTANPRGMDFNAWIDAKTLGTFGDITKEVLNDKSVKSAKDIQEAFLKTVLGRLKTTSPIPSLPEYSHIFHTGGRLQDVPKQGFKPLTHVMNMFLGKENGKFQPNTHHAYNVERVVANLQQQKQYADDIAVGLEKFRDGFHAAREHMPLTIEQEQLLVQEERAALASLKSAQKASLRKLVNQSIRKSEGNFLNRVSHYLITAGQLSDDVHLLDGSGKPLKGFGNRNLKDLLQKTKFYMEEFLNRVIANPTTGEITSEALSAEMKQTIGLRLFNNGGKSWFQRNLLPNLGDGLISYAYKSKYYIVLLPIAVTLAVGCSMVYVNNWLTRMKMGGKSVFPGEEALKKGMGGGH